MARIGIIGSEGRMGKAIAEAIAAGHRSGRSYSIVVVAEGYELTRASGETVRDLASAIDLPSFSSFRTVH